MVKKIIAIGTLILTMKAACFYLFKKKQKSSELETITNSYLKKEITLEYAVLSIKQDSKKIKILSYINCLLASIGSCFTFSIPLIISYNYPVSELTVVSSLLIEILAFAIIPKISFDQHERLSNIIDQCNNECIALLKKA